MFDAEGENDMDWATNEKLEIERFFSTLQAKRESFADFMRLYESTLAPRFNLFDFIGPNENKLSEIIAFFLDPEETHGQGYLFLRIFLDLIGRNEKKEQSNEPLQIFLDALENHLNSNTKVTCTLERATDLIEASQRRIDIEFQVGNICLAIENKPWACDQVEQITDYNKQLVKRYGENHYLLIYLSGTGEPPSEESIAENKREALIDSGHLKILPYREFIPCVNQFKTHCQSERVRYFLQDFEDYLKTQFEGGMAMYEKDMMMEYILSDPKNLKIALAVSQTQDDVKEKLLKDLKGMLERNCPAQLEWDIDNFRGAKYQSFSFKKDTWSNYKITFEFDGAQGRGFGYGVSKDKEEQLNIIGIADRLGVGQCSSWWPWYRDFEAPYYDWSVSNEPWVDILKGGGMLKATILDQVKRIAEVLDQMQLNDDGVPSLRKD